MVLMPERCHPTDLFLTRNKLHTNLVHSMHYISLMDVAQNLIFITSYYIYFKLLMILFSI